MHVGAVARTSIVSFCGAGRGLEDQLLVAVAASQVTVPVVPGTGGVPTARWKKSSGASSMRKNWAIESASHGPVSAQLFW